MKRTLVTGGKLALICGIAAIILGLVNAVTEPVIKINQKKELEAAIRRVAGDKKVGEQVLLEEGGVVEYYYPPAGGDEAFIVKLLGSGYGGDMHILAGYFTSGEIFSVVLMDNQETPGLGKKAESSEYMDKFIGLGSEKNIPVRKDLLPQEEADSVTGATITYAGIAAALQEGSAFIRSMGENE